MCRFDLLILPGSAEPLTVLRSEGKGFTRLRMPALQKFVPNGSQIGFIGRTCDCGSVLGSWEPPEDAASWEAARIARIHKEAQRHRRSGWGEHKIERWLEEKLAERPPCPPPREGVPDEAWRWLRILEHLLQELSLPWVGLLLFSGRQDQESLPLKDPRELRLRRLDAEALLHLREDVLYLVRP